MNKLHNCIKNATLHKSKILLIMKLYLVCLLLALQVSAKNYAQQKITLNVKNQPIASVLKSIESQTSYKFFYSNDVVPSQKLVSINITDAEIPKVMDLVLENLPLTWKQLDAIKIVINANAKQAKSALLTEVTGTVKNLKGETLEAVTVREQKTNATTVTNSKGFFTLNVKDNNATLLFSLVGYKSQAVALSNSNNINVTLIEEAKVLEDLVVIGYGTNKRKSLTTSVSTVNAQQIEAVPVADAAQALQGRVAGVTIVQNSGAPGGTGGTAIRIRGLSSITRSNNPLIVVDGYPLPDQEADNVLNSFGTGDIERIDVLKDAGATSIYGVRGSNGVIVITTKRGKAGKANLSVDVYRGLQEAWRLPKMLNAQQYAILNTEARVASGLAPIPKLIDNAAIANQYGEGTNWLNEIFRRAAIQSVNISATGGSEKAQYSFGAGYFKQDGILNNTDFERFNLRFNGDIKVNSRIKIGNSLTMNKFIEHGADTYTPFNSNIILALTAPPTVKPFNDDGTYAGGIGSVDGYDEPNPIYQLEVPKNNNIKYRVTGNIYTEIDIIKDLKFKAMFGADFNIQENTSFSPATPSSGGRPIIQTGYFAQKLINPDYLAEYTLSYDKRITKKHKLNTIIGYTFQENRYSFVNGSRTGTFAQQIPALNPIVFNPLLISQINNGAEDGISRRLASYFGRINYDYDNRGYFGFSIRQDGSSNFAPKNKFAIFPSVSAAWRLTEEPFMKSINWLNELKVRASFGYVGNQNVEPFVYLQRLNPGFQYSLGNSTGPGGAILGTAPATSFNPDIEWEKNEQLNVGFDASVLKNKLSVSLDVYQRRSIDLILDIEPAFVSGTFGSVPFNTGTMQNRGIDLTLNANLYNTKNFSWVSNAVIGTFKNKVTSFGKRVQPVDGGFARITGGSLRTIQGSTANFFYGFQTEGIFQNYKEIAEHAVQTAGTDPTTSTAPGDIKFKDINGDGVINDLDRTNLGNAVPNFTYGFTNTLTYKNVELTIFLQGSVGNKVLNFTRWYTEGGVSNGNYSNAVIGRWNGEGTSNTMPRLVLNDPNGNNRVSDRFVEDASYMRIKNVRLAYNLPNKIATKLNLSNTQIYASCQNLLTVTDYSGLDPEVGGGVDVGFYPQARTVLFGIKVNF
jgi:TonB-dependent starch-binding outer membrane protein SusC